MKIIFKNEKEKERLIEILAETMDCPSMLGLEESELCDHDGTQEMCEECWRNALEEMEVEENDF